MERKPTLGVFMPDKYGPLKGGDNYTQEIRIAMIGWTILAVGKTESKKYEDGEKGMIEGGLTFMLEKDGKRRKVILGYTELGEWLEHKEDLK
jgi:hypothetical protein